MNEKGIKWKILSIMIKTQVHLMVMKVIVTLIMNDLLKVKIVFQIYGFNSVMLYFRPALLNSQYLCILTDMLKIRIIP